MDSTLTQAGPVLGSIGRRFGAALIDVFVLIVPAFVFGMIIPYAGGFILTLLYFPVLEASPMRGTLGKKIMDLQIVTLAGGQITYQQAFIRYVVKFVSSCMLFIGHFFAFFTEKKQAAHDLVAKTIVVHGVTQVSVGDAWLASMRSIFGGSDDLQTIEKLYELKMKGAITEEEFQRQKAKLGLSS